MPAPITDAVTTQWKSFVTGAARETLQCRAGQIELSTDAVPDPQGGTALIYPFFITVPAGKTVRYRLVGGSTAVLTREIFE